MKTTFHPCRSENVGRGACLLIAGEYVWLSFPFHTFITDLEGFAKESYKSLLITPAGDGGKRVGLKKKQKISISCHWCEQGITTFLSNGTLLCLSKKKGSFPWFCFSWRKEMPIPTIEQCIVAFPKGKVLHFLGFLGILFQGVEVWISDFLDWTTGSPVDYLRKWVFTKSTLL